MLSSHFVCVQIQVTQMSLQMSSRRKAQITCFLSSWLKQPPLWRWKEVGGLSDQSVVIAGHAALGTECD